MKLLVNRSYLFIQQSDFCVLKMFKLAAEKKIKKKKKIFDVSIF